MAVQLKGGIISSSLLLSPSTSITRSFSIPLLSSHSSCQSKNSIFTIKEAYTRSKRRPISLVVKSGNSGDSETINDEKAEFGYSRKDVLLIGVGVTLAGYGLKYGLEFVGVDPLQAGNAVQLIIVLGMTVGWIFSYVFRVANKDMTYAAQLKDYEKKVMEKRLESLTEAELQVLLEQVEEEKVRLKNRDSSLTQNP